VGGWETKYTLKPASLSVPALPCSKILSPAVVCVNGEPRDLAVYWFFYCPSFAWD